MAGGGITITQREGEPGAAGPTAAHLFRLLSCECLRSPSSRHRLDGLTTVTLGRGDGPLPRSTRHLGLSIPDQWMSGKHAELVRVGPTWVLVDAGSKNGTRLNGSTAQRAPLTDGDLIEVGHTFFLFRDAVPVAADEAIDVDSSALQPPVPGLATLVLPLEREFARLAEIARSPTTVMILGESGTGKEWIARAVHTLSGRSGQLVAINCGALPRELIEGELFGHRRGAFSGAREDHAGLIRTAHGGTLFLDEIGDLPLESQAPFLRVLQEAEVRPVGATRSLPVDLRVVTATHRDLRALVESGTFRADLYARLVGFSIHLPPLRQRREDLGLLIGSMLRRSGATLSLDAARALLQHDWPLNIRELEKVLSAATVLARGGAIGLDLLPGLAPRPQGIAAPSPARRDPALTDDDLRRRAEIVTLLREHGGNIAAVARATGKGRFQIHRWIKRFAIELDDYRR